MVVTNNLLFLKGLEKMLCTNKHTMYQPTDSEWKCPKCGSVDDFLIDNEMLAENECELLHEKDLILCWKCSFSLSGKTFARRLIQEKNLIICPTCQGKGHILNLTLVLYHGTMEN